MVHFIYLILVLLYLYKLIYKCTTFCCNNNIYFSDLQVILICTHTANYQPNFTFIFPTLIFINISKYTANIWDLKSELAMISEINSSIPG